MGWQMSSCAPETLVKPELVLLTAAGSHYSTKQVIMLSSSDKSTLGSHRTVICLEVTYTVPHSDWRSSCTVYIPSLSSLTVWPGCCMFLQSHYCVQLNQGVELIMQHNDRLYVFSLKLLCYLSVDVCLHMFAGRRRRSSSWTQNMKWSVWIRSYRDWNKRSEAAC